MSQCPFSYECEKAGPGTFVYKIKGRLLGRRECYALQEDVHERVKAGGVRIALSLSEVDHLDSAGVGILASIYTSVQNAKGAMVLAGLSPAARKVLGLSWFLNLMDHTDTLEDGLAKLGAAGQ
jgi:anti-anti-sigma factor